MLHRFVKLRKESFGGFLYDAKNHKLFYVNKTGFEIIEGMKKGLSIDTIINQLVQTYKIQENEVRNSVNNFIKELKRFELLEV
ncbi:MAG: PqqD family peptide modification chaperone [Thermoprotei archaeon]